ncbi:FtsH protease activity modulator HflK [Candidatus Omnitrophota bacterium]
MDFNTPEELLNMGKKQLGDARNFAPFFVLIVVVLLGLKGSIYTIGADEVGVVQRFGRYVATTDPGLHVKLPFGIDKATPIKVKKIFKEEFGVRTLSPGVRTKYAKGDYTDESLMLTGDLNILDVRWIVQFRVKDPVKLLFQIRSPRDTIMDISEVVMRRLVGDYRVDEVLTLKREEVDHLAQVELQKILDYYDSGIQIVTVKLQDVNPPDEVKPAFNEVNEAKQEKERVINQAWEAYNKVVPRARGEAERTIREAEGYSLGKINSAKGEAEKFLSVLEEYKNAKEITKKRYYLETMSKVLPKAKQKYIIDPQQTSILPLLNIGEKAGAQL